MNPEQLRERAMALHLNGVLAHWPEVVTSEWLPKLVAWEEEERTRRSLEHRACPARAENGTSDLPRHRKAERDETDCENCEAVQGKA